MFADSVSYSNIEEDQKDLKSVEVAELDTIPKQNLDKNAHFNGNNYETVIFIVLGLCLAFIVIIVLLLVIYFCARKKTVNEQNPQNQRPENEPDYDASILIKNCSYLF